MNHKPNLFDAIMDLLTGAFVVGAMLFMLVSACNASENVTVSPAKDRPVRLVRCADKIKISDGYIFIAGFLNPEVSKMLIDLMETESIKKPTIQVVINSNGGDMQASLSIIVEMERLKATGTRFVCLGDRMVASGAAWISYYCNENYMFSDAKLFDHFPISVETNKPVLSNTDKTTLLAHQLLAWQLGITRAEYEKLKTISGTTWSAEDAARYGFIDGICKEGGIKHEGTK